MPDQSVEYQIKTTADTSGQKQTAAANEEVAASAKRLNDIFKANGAASKEKASADKEVAASVINVTKAEADAATAGAEANEERKKSFASLHDLKSAAKGLRDEFPMLAHVFRLATNPIAFVVAGIAGAFAIWKMRVDELAKSLTGVQLPDNKAMEPGHINAVATAWKAYADAVNEGFKGLQSVEKQAGAAIKALDAAVARQRTLTTAQAEADKARLEADHAMGRISDAEYQRRKLALGIHEEQGKRGEDEAARARKLNALEKESKDLQVDAAKKKGEAGKIHVGSEKDDAGTLEALKAQADAAKKTLDEANRRRGDIAEARDSTFGALKFAPQFYARYGTMSGTDAMALEESRAQSAQDIIDRYNKRMKDQAGRDEARKKRGTLLGEAAGEEVKAGELGQEVAAGRDELGKDSAAGRQAGINREIAATATALAEGAQKLKELKDSAAQQVEHTGQANAQSIKNMRLQEQLNAELIAHQRTLEGQLANARNRQ